jgi:SAM-dependent methyltransferase
MASWSNGYVADIGYTYGYYTELNPLKIRLPLLAQGLVVPDIFAACELGFGQGVSVNMHAAASCVNWFGTDFNPSQVLFAQELASASRAKVSLVDDAFDKFAIRQDLPEFDYIGLHGIWSWISDSNRQILVDFIDRKLKVGGVLYISYNTLPGWAAFAPLRHLMTAHSDTMTASGSSTVARVEEALSFAGALLEKKPGYSNANPQVEERLNRLKKQDRYYLAHEYFNRDWMPMHFDTMFDWLSNAKLSFACSAHPLDHVDALNLTDAQSTMLSTIENIRFKETVRDFMTNQQFRRDYWIKGPRRLNEVEQRQLLRASRHILINYRPDITLTVTGSLGEATMNENIYRPILDIMADHNVWSIGALEEKLEDQNINLQKILQAITVLTGGGNVAPAQDDDKIGAAEQSISALNAHILQKAIASDELSYLASPVIAGGIPVNRIQQLFILAINNGAKSTDLWADYAWKKLSSIGHKLLKDGAKIESKEDSLNELNERASEFKNKRLDILKALKIVNI